MVTHDPYYKVYNNRDFFNNYMNGVNNPPSNPNPSYSFWEPQSYNGPTFINTDEAPTVHMNG